MMNYWVKEVSMGTEYSDEDGNVVKVQTTPVDGGKAYVYEVFNVDRSERGRFFSNHDTATDYAVSMLKDFAQSDWEGSTLERRGL
jgi:hypothetical protein